MFYILDSSHVKRTPSIDLLKSEFINHLTVLASCKIKPLAYKYRRQDRESVILALLLNVGYQGSCGCNYHHDWRQPQLKFSVSVPNPERGTKELPAAERMSMPFGVLSRLPLTSLPSQRLACPLRRLSQEADDLAAQVLGFHSQWLTIGERSSPVWLAQGRSCSAPWSYHWGQRAGSTIGPMWVTEERRGKRHQEDKRWPL